MIDFAAPDDVRGLKLAVIVLAIACVFLAFRSLVGMIDADMRESALASENYMLKGLIAADFRAWKTRATGPADVEAG